MLAANRLHSTLKKGATAFGAWQMLAGANLARQLAGTGVDWVCVDTEHGNIDDAQMHDAVTAIAATGISPMVRIADNESWMVKRALDCGAHAIMCPMIKTAADAKKLVDCAKFPPQGSRGFGSPFSQQSFKGIETQTEYLQQSNDALLTVVQIENREGLANVEEIAAVPGVDVLFVGPFDLGNNIGHPIINGMDDELMTAIKKIHKAAVDHGKWTGMFCTVGQAAREFADLGFHMINVCGDVPALQTYIAQEVKTAKGSIAHSAYNTVKGAVSQIGGYGK